MRSFTTEGAAGAQTPEGLEPITFTLDGGEYTALPPTETQFGLMLAAVSSNKGAEEGLAALLDFFMDMFSDEEQAVLNRRLRDRDDAFGFEVMYEIVEGLVEEWTARPTKPSSGSTESRRSAGRKSTAKQRSKAPASAR